MLLRVSRVKELNTSYRLATAQVDVKSGDLHRKIHVIDIEQGIYKVGDSLRVVETSPGKTGLTS